MEDAKRACIFDFDRAMRALSARLGSKAFVMGDTFTVPDLLLGHCAGWAKAFGWAISDGNVTDYFARIAARPAYLAAKARREAS